jgi:hypothetical protein
MNDALDFEPLIRQLEAELETDFPGWLIAREASGRWSAKLPEWGELYGDSAPQLRERLRLYARGAAHEHR